MEKQKILQISTTPLQYDGLTEVILSIAEGAKGLDVEMDILAGMGIAKDFKPRLDEMGLNVISSPDRSKSVISYMNNLRSLLKTGGYNAVHVHGNSATMAIEITIAWIMGVAIRISHCHNTKTNHPRIHRILKNPLNAFVTLPIACGRAAGEFLYTREFKVFPNAIDLNRFAFDKSVREKIRGELGLDREVLIGHVGRFSYQKNHDFLIDIFVGYNQRNPDSRLLLIGEGDLYQPIKRKVKDLGLSEKVIFKGTVDNVNEYMQAMDVFLLPSRYEGLSVTAVEAQAAGLTVIMTDTVDKETKLTDNCVFIPEASDLKRWNSEISKAHQKVRKSPLSELRQKGYGKEDIPERLSDIYQL